MSLASIFPRGHKIFNCLHKDAWLVNESHLLWRNDETYALTRARGRDFALTLTNFYNPNQEHTFTSLFNLCSSAHYVCPNKRNSCGFECSCKGFFTRGECSHAYRIAQVTRTFDIERALASISRAKINGWPRQYQPVGYSAHAPKAEITVVQAAQFFGLAVAVRFQNYSDRPFVGTIINARPMGTSSANTVMMYMASFNDQLGDCPDSCELTQDEMMSAHRLYISYHKEAKKRKTDGIP
jgi:hypothetical protein